MYDKVLVLDTSNATENLGDFIIMDAVNRQLRKMFPDDFFVYSTTHDAPSNKGYEWADAANFKFIGGSNLLSARFIGRNRAQWRFGFKDATRINNLIGVGLGWQSDISYNSIFSKPFVVAQKHLYHKALSNEYIHSVRDSFTQAKLAEYGIKSINTACVTMWDLTTEHLRKIPTIKADKVVMTITDYRDTLEHRRSYKQMIEVLFKMYTEVEMWIQSPGDIELLKKLNLSNLQQIKFINPNLVSYDSALDQDVDYVGTRLHAGIRALQHGRRTLIIEVDNRAREIAKDTNLPTLSYLEMDKLENVLSRELVMDINVPFEQIDLWKQQFN